MRVSSYLVAATAVATTFAQLEEIDYIIGDTLVLPYSDLNTSDGSIDVYFNWGSTPCTESMDECFYFARLPNNGAINYNPQYGKTKTVGQLFIPAGEDGLAGTVDVSFLEDGHNESNSYEVAASATFWQPILFETNQTGGVWQCGESYQSISINVRTSLISTYSDFDTYTLALVRVVDDDTWETVETAIGTIDSDQIHHLLTGWTTITLVDAHVPTVDQGCESGSHDLILNAAFGDNGVVDPDSRYAFYNVLGVDSRSVFLSFDQMSMHLLLSDRHFPLYEAVNFTIAYMSSDRDVPFVAVMVEDETADATLLGCSPPYVVGDYTTFGWFGIDLENIGGNDTDVAFDAGHYHLEMLYYPFEDDSDEQLGFLGRNMVNYLITTANETLVHIIEQNMTVDAISIALVESDSDEDDDGGDSNDADDEEALSDDDDDNKLKLGKEYEFEIRSSLNGSTVFSYVVNQNRDDTAQLQGDDDEDCYVAGTLDFTGNPTKWSLKVPKGCDKKMDLVLHFSAVPCRTASDVESEQALQGVAIFKLKGSGGSSSNSNGLSTGGIVGIVFAVLLVVGLTVFFFVMRKRRAAGGDGYHTMV